MLWVKYNKCVNYLKTSKLACALRQCAMPSLLAQVGEAYGDV
jgi:hypothetical protein